MVKLKAAKPIVNQRKLALDRISTKIATFVVTETYTNEREAQQHLAEAIAHLDAAVLLLVASDEEASFTGGQLPM